MAMLLQMLSEEIRETKKDGKGWKGRKEKEESELKGIIKIE